jgi:ketosteroid isomerase-like protein
MSEENMEIVRTAVEALSAGDFDALLKVSEPDIEFQSYLASLSEGGTAYHGHDGLRRYQRDLLEAWEYYRAEIREYRDAGEMVVALGDIEARGRASGVEVKRPLAWVITMPGEKATRVQVFLDPAEALEAAGLSK